MTELYTAIYGPEGLRFSPREDRALLTALDEDAVPGYAVQAALGDEELLHCLVLRREEGPGGLFILEDDMDTLLAVVAESNLAYAESLNHFAEMVAQARYAADMYESKDEDGE